MSEERKQKGTETRSIRNLLDMFQAIQLIVSKLDLILDILNDFLTKIHKDDQG